MENKLIKFKDYSINTNIYENKGKPTILLLHGFPDNSHLYDLLVPELTKLRMCIFNLQMHLYRLSFLECHFNQY